MPILGSSASQNIKSFLNPNAPTIGTATNVGTSRAYNNGSATITFTAAASGAAATSFTATSSPGSYTVTGASSPLTVTGLQSATAYTFVVKATNAVGDSSNSSASNSITATTVPQAPTIGSATAGNGSSTVSYTAGATGGAAVSTFTATSSGGQTGTGASPITVSGSNGTAYTFTVRATNANGQSAASSASNSVTPFVPYTPRALMSTGPGGGKIVYDAGSNLSWGRYIEVLPEGGSYHYWPSGAFSYKFTDVASTSFSSSTAVGTGYTNTENAFNQGLSSPSYTFCGQAWNYTGGGKSDWFVPSSDDFEYIKNALYIPGDNIYLYAAQYVTSSQINATQIYGKWGNTGSPGTTVLGKTELQQGTLTRYVNQSEG